jgi:prepilin-type N-terminal cleavage/methylation domain-containing protein
MRRPGFTLIELLIVVVIIGILATVAIPHFRDTKGKANAASIKADLRNLVSAQEGYYYSHGEYADNVGSLDFNTTNGVVITTLAKTATGSGWSAVATHPAAFPLRCAIFFGDATSPDAAAATEGVIGCR